MILLAPLLWIFFAIASSMAASNRGHSGFVWFILGLLFGPFALIFALLLSNKKPLLIQIPAAAAPAPLPLDDTKTCPTCAETIKFAALKCRFCGHNFDPDLVKEYLATIDAKRQDPKYCPSCGRSDVRTSFRIYPGGSSGYGPWCPHCKKGVDI